MRLPEYSRGRSRRQRLVLRVARHAGVDFDDVVRVCLRRPAFFGTPFLALAQEVLRGDSVWSAGEREFFAAVVSGANRCGFCVGTHAEIARLTLGPIIDDTWKDGRYGAQATAAENVLQALTRNPDLVPRTELTAARAAGLDEAALIDALYVAYMFNVINRIADALDFTHRSERDRLRGAWILRHNGYRLPAWLLR
ncbi:MAG TPA: hypothetical protein VGN48_12260 [Pedococcus sp.]|nr:hypothetical protein [Pedococcus sp.]